MKWQQVMAGVILAGYASAAPTAQRDAARSDQQILEQIERDWDQAFLHRDTAFIDRVLADEFVATYDDGSVGGKERELALAAAFNQQVDSSSIDDVVVKIFGDTAVVHFSRHLAGPSKGRRLEVHFRFTDVFVWRADRWQCVASQSTKVAAP